MDPERHQELDECLELLYHLRERHQLDLSALQEHDPSTSVDTLKALAATGLITLTEERIGLTEEGFRRAEQIIRRHRLAERLLADVLHMSPAEVERGACEFEHLVAEEITESICTLLGHPRTCPHGSPIPEGQCCRTAARDCPSAIVPLTEAPVGTWARVAYISSGSDERQHRLTHFGIVPGALVKLHQLKPSVIVMLESSRLAMEEPIAREIFVWKKWEDENAVGQTASRPSLLRFWKR
jgi:DtxR family Mn-dependent transcriptional regulator